VFGHPAEVLENYGSDRLVLMVRDPYWLHAYWEVTEQSIQRAREQLAEDWDGHRWILRVQIFQQSADGAAGGHFDIDLNPDARNWYLRVPHPDCSYEATIGLITRSGTFYPFARSGRVHTPRDSMSTVVDEQWVSSQEEAEKIYESSGGRAFTASSAELAEKGPLGHQHAMFSGMLASMGSGALGAPPHRGFWFQVNTELIVYGATEPDAKVTIQGREIQLRPDGTFTVRFQLPDGVQEIPCVATSGDGISERTITPTVKRQTKTAERELASESGIER
jgi:hypothetical protein